LKRSFKSLYGLTLAGLLFAGATARADLIPWTYNWTPSAPAIFANSPGTGKITMTNEPLGAAVGTSDIVATNLKVFSSADPAKPDTFSNAKYTLTLTLTDTDSKASGTLAFTGEFNGTISSMNSNVTNTFTSAVTQSIVLGKNLYKVTIGQFTPPAPPGATNSGSISATTMPKALVTVTKNPEPSTVLMAGLGLSFVGLVSWRKRRRVQAL
jgi:PEP-CTERM motif